MKEHFTSNSQEYRDLTPQKYMGRAGRVLPDSGRLIRLKFMTSTTPAEMHYKSCDGWFSLQRSTEPELFHQACRIAIERGRYSYRFIRQLVESRCMGAYRRQTLPSPPEHCNIRGKEQFQ